MEIFIIIHIVEPRDTISSIALKYGISPKRLIMDNGLLGQSYLVVGQALVVLIPNKIHIVRQGESIYSIANMYEMTVIELMQKNPQLIYNTELTVGDEIIISFEGESDRKIYINGYIYPYVNRNILKYALPFLTDLTIFGYGFTEEGELIPIDDNELISLAYEFKTAPIMLLCSIGEDGTFSGERAKLLFNDIELQNKVIDNILIVMKEKGYLGLDVDFEYVEQEDSAAFLRFLENITNRMHENGYRVNVDLAPKTSAEQKGLLYESHNYAAIGAIADTVLLMTYEWGYTYGPPMAVAPLPNVRLVVSYAVTEIPTDKIMMGIPNYGYDWTLPYERGITQATSIGNEEAVVIAANNSATIKFDEVAQSPFFEYIDVDGKNHIVWFEDVRSIKGKLGLITEFNLRGGGYWNLMRPFNQNWALLSQMFKIVKVVK